MLLVIMHMNRFRHGDRYLGMAEGQPKVLNEACDDLQNGRISGRSIINFDD